MEGFSISYSIPQHLLTHNNNQTIDLYIFFHMVIHMERKLREIAGCYVITIPKQVCDLFCFEPNDTFSIKLIRNNELRLRKI